MLSLLSLYGQIDPRHMANVTLYHEGPPAGEKLKLVNQDTGDVRGDAYFVLRGLMLPVECKSKSTFAHFDCDNPEQNSTRNVVSQNIVTVDTRYGRYGSCNQDPDTGKYKCFCGWPHKRCGAQVGRTDVASREARYPLPPRAEAWMYWRDNLATKVGGDWYSTHDVGQCTDDATEATTDATDACTWRLTSTVRTIVAQCLETRVAQAVVAYNTSCFAACPQPHNASSACVVDCYFATLLGPRGGSHRITPSEGLPVHLIQDAWTKAFASADPARGGCPDADDPASRAPWPLSWSRRARESLVT